MLDARVTYYQVTQAPVVVHKGRIAVASSIAGRAQDPADYDGCGVVCLCARRCCVAENFEGEMKKFGEAPEGG